MKIITSNDELEVGKEYWCKSKTATYSPNPQVLRCDETGGWKYIGSRIWAMEENNQALEKFDILGPLEYPNYEDYKDSNEKN